MCNTKLRPNKLRSPLSHHLLLLPYFLSSAEWFRHLQDGTGMWMCPTSCFPLPCLVNITACVMGSVWPRSMNPPVSVQQPDRNNWDSKYVMEAVKANEKGHVATNRALWMIFKKQVMIWDRCLAIWWMSYNLTIAICDIAKIIQIMLQASAYKDYLSTTFTALTPPTIYCCVTEVLHRNSTIMAWRQQMWVQLHLYNIIIFNWCFCFFNKLNVSGAFSCCGRCQHFHRHNYSITWTSPIMIHGIKVPCFFYKWGPMFLKGGWKEGEQQGRGRTVICCLRREGERERDGRQEPGIIKRRGGRWTAGCLAVGVDHQSAKCRAKSGQRERERECKLIIWEELKIKGCWLFSGCVLTSLSVLPSSPTLTQVRYADHCLT